MDLFLIWDCKGCSQCTRRKRGWDPTHSGSSCDQVRKWTANVNVCISRWENWSWDNLKACAAAGAYWLFVALVSEYLGRFNRPMWWVIRPWMTPGHMIGAVDHPSLRHCWRCSLFIMLCLPRSSRALKYTLCKLRATHCHNFACSRMKRCDQSTVRSHNFSLISHNFCSDTGCGPQSWTKVQV